MEIGSLATGSKTYTGSKSVAFGFFPWTESKKCHDLLLSKPLRPTFKTKKNDFAGH